MDSGNRGNHSSSSKLEQHRQRHRQCLCFWRSFRPRFPSRRLSCCWLARGLLYSSAIVHVNRSYLLLLTAEAQGPSPSSSPFLVRTTAKKPIALGTSLFALLPTNALFFDSPDPSSKTLSGLCLKTHGL
jgi:hypothetical protein